MFDVELLFDLAKDFYNLTGVTISIRDSDFNEICFYPKKINLISGIEKEKNQSLSSGEKACNDINNMEYPCVYTYYSGIYSAVFPVHYDNNIISYIILGEIRDEEKCDNSEDSKKLFRKFEQEKNDVREYLKGLPVLKQSQIFSATRILSMCILYLNIAHPLKIEENDIASKIDKYIIKNLSTLKKIDEICEEFNISQSYLYKLSHKYFHMPIGNYITFQRINAAKQHLMTTQDAISTISELCGFCDYNYFIRKFKKQTGYTPLAYRKKALNNKWLDLKI